MLNIFLSQFDKPITINAYHAISQEGFKILVITPAKVSRCMCLGEGPRIIMKDPAIDLLPWTPVSPMTIVARGASRSK